MAGPSRVARLAILIDADNSNPARLPQLLAEIAKFGNASVRRAYGNWTSGHLGGWKNGLLTHSIQPIQQFNYTTGKNATDSALIIDAMDLLYTGNLDGFCLVSSDSDFTKLASRLRESGKTVYGFGEPKTPHSLVAACDKFVYLDVLRRAEKSGASSPEAEETPAARAPSRRTTAELRGDAKLVRLLREGVDASSDDEGWANLGTMGNHVNKQASDFDPRNWGYAKLVDLVTAIELFEVTRAPGQGVRVREKPKGQAASGTGQGGAGSAGQGGARKATKKSAKKAPATPSS